jgi:hypothetical protein
MQSAMQNKSKVQKAAPFLSVQWVMQVHKQNISQKDIGMNGVFIDSNGIPWPVAYSAGPVPTGSLPS